MKENMLLTLIFSALCADLRVNGMVFKFVPGGDTIRNAITPFLSSFNTTDADGNPTYTANVVRVVDPILAMRFAQDDLVSSPEDYNRLSPYPDYYFSSQNSQGNDRVGDPRYSPSIGSRFGLLPPWAHIPNSPGDLLVFGPDHFDHDRRQLPGMFRGPNPYLPNDDYLNDFVHPLEEYPVIERYPLGKPSPKFNPSHEDSSQSSNRNGDNRSFLSQNLITPQLQKIPPISRSNIAPYLRENQGLNPTLGDSYLLSPYELGDQVSEKSPLIRDHLSNSHPLPSENLGMNLNAKPRGPYINSPYESEGRAATRDPIIELHPSEYERPISRQNQLLNTSPRDSYLNDVRKVAGRAGSKDPSLGAYLSKYGPYLGEQINSRLNTPYSSDPYESDSQAKARNSFDGPHSSKYEPTSRQNQKLTLKPSDFSSNGPHTFMGQAGSEDPSLGAYRSILEPLLREISNSRSNIPYSNGPYVSVGRRAKRDLLYYGPYNPEYEPTTRKNQGLNSIPGGTYSIIPRKFEGRVGSEDPSLGSYWSKYEPFLLQAYNSRSGGLNSYDPSESYGQIGARIPYVKSYNSEYEPVSRQTQGLNSIPSNSYSSDPLKFDGQMGLEDQPLGAYRSKYEPMLRENSNSILSNPYSNGPYELDGRAAIRDHPFIGPYSSEYEPIARQNQGPNLRSSGWYSNGPRKFDRRAESANPSLRANRPKYEHLLRENSNSGLSNSYSNSPYELDGRAAVRNHPFIGPYNSKYEPSVRQNQGPNLRSSGWYSNDPRKFDGRVESADPSLRANKPKYEPLLREDFNSKTGDPYSYDPYELDGRVTARNPIVEPYILEYEPISRQTQGLSSKPSNLYPSDPRDFDTQMRSETPSLGAYRSKYEPLLRGNSNSRSGDPYSYDPKESNGRIVGRNPIVNRYRPEYEPIFRQTQGLNSKPIYSYPSDPRDFDARMDPEDPSLGAYRSKYEPLLRELSNSRSRDPYSYGPYELDGRVAGRNLIVNRYRPEYEPISRQTQGLNSRPSNLYSGGPREIEGQTGPEVSSLGAYRSKYEPLLTENSNSILGDPYLYDPDELDSQVAETNPFVSMYEPALHQNVGYYSPNDLEDGRASRGPFFGPQQPQYEPLLNGDLGLSSRFGDPYLNDPYSFWSRSAIRDPFIGTHHSGYDSFPTENPGSILRSFNPYADDSHPFEGPYDSNFRSSYDPSVYDNVGCFDWLKGRKNLDDDESFGTNPDSSATIPSPLITNLINKLLTSTNRMDDDPGSVPLGSYGKAPFKIPYDSNNVNYGIFEPNFGNYPIYSFDNTNPVQNFNHQNNPSFSSKEPPFKVPNKAPFSWASDQKPTFIVSPFKHDPHFPQSIFTPVALSLLGRDTDEEADNPGSPSDLSPEAPQPSDFNSDGIRTNWPKDPRTFRIGGQDGPEKMDLPTMPQSDKIPALMIIPTPTGDQSGRTGGTQGDLQGLKEEPNLDTINSTKNINLLPIQLPKDFLKTLINSGLLSVLLNDMPGGDDAATRSSMGKPGHINTYDQNPLIGAKTPGKSTLLNPKHHNIELYNPMLRGYHGGINPFAQHHKGYGYKSY